MPWGLKHPLVLYLCLRKVPAWPLAFQVAPQRLPAQSRIAGERLLNRPLGNFGWGRIRVNRVPPAQERLRTRTGLGRVVRSKRPSATRSPGFWWMLLVRHFSVGLAGLLRRPAAVNVYNIAVDKCKVD
ncbi:hypothetical protein EDB80DRAFT_694361 [Ilyonectria destructans]|nr:hypothetical protein EDB80DRAFT_694361 [Ilyonectria destructans]